MHPRPPGLGPRGPPARCGLSQRGGVGGQVICQGSHDLTQSRQFCPLHGNSHFITTDHCEMSLTKSVSSGIKKQKNLLEVRARKASSEVQGHGPHVKILRLHSHSDGLKQILGLAKRLKCRSLKPANSFFPEQRLESRAES